MKVKKLTAGLLAVAITVSLIAPEAFAEISGANSVEKVTVSGLTVDTPIKSASGDTGETEEPSEPSEDESVYTYGVLEDGTIEILGYNGSGGNVVIPAEIDGMSVTGIGNDAFYYCTNLTSIIIPDSVKNISDSAFFGCTNLAEIKVATKNLNYVSVNGVLYNKKKTILKWFPAGKKDKNYKIIDGVTKIGYSAFNNCTNLINITMPDSLTNIGKRAFTDCTNLASITIPNDVTDIGEYTFYNCQKLTSVTLPNSLISIGESAFSKCDSLTGITIPNNVTSIDSFAFSDCKSLSDITIPDSVKSIGYSAFCNCTSITTITIPSSVTSIGNYAFSGCADLTEIKVAAKNTNYVSVNGVLYNKNKTTLICYPQGKKGNNYNIIDSVTSIEGNAFNGCANLTDITIPDSVKSIGPFAFDSCSSLTNITIPSGIKSISEYTFNDCASLTNMTIPHGVTSIGYNAFSGCTNLASITIPKTVTSIGWYAFSKCSGLSSVTIPDSVLSIDERAFYECPRLTSITIPGSVTYIDRFAFGFYHDGKNINDAKYKSFKIYCYKGTAGEQYAKDNGFTYELLDKPTLAKVSGVKLGGRAADALRINWTKNANADGYIVEMYQGGKWVRVAKITNNSTTTFKKAGLKAGTAYKFRVKAYKMYDRTAVYSAYSATVAARTNPSVIKGAKLSGRAADALRINWSKNASADGYIVEMYQGGKWVRVAKITNNNTTTFRKAGLKASSVYKFRVRAYKMSGSTALYGNYSATVTARTNPSIVKGVKIGGKAKDALRVNWAKNASAQGYIVEMYKGGKWVRVAKITNGNTTTFRKAGLAKNTAYKFRVKAYYMSGKTALYGGYGSVSGKTAVK